MKFSIAKLQKNILKTYQKSLKAKHKNNKNKELSSIEERKVNTNLCYNGKSFVTWQIVILKIKIKLVSITAAANCNEHIL